MYFIQYLIPPIIKLICDTHYFMKTVYEYLLGKIFLTILFLCTTYSFTFLLVINISFLDQLLVHPCHLQ